MTTKASDRLWGAGTALIVFALVPIIRGLVYMDGRGDFVQGGVLIVVGIAAVVVARRK